MGIESFAVTQVENLIAKSDFLISYFNKNDKGTSFDGYIEVYKTAGDTHRKSDLFERISVQVKGHKTTTLTRKEISFQIERADLINYLNGGGVLYFVVYMDPAYDKSKVYYGMFKCKTRP